jgi:hypothetical protein
MIVGSGNDRPTPRVVLDMVYSGLYKCAGHVVPYLVLVKIGKTIERSHPGNRDSQMLLMHLLNKVRFFILHPFFHLQIYLTGSFQSLQIADACYPQTPADVFVFNLLQR